MGQKEINTWKKLWLAPVIIALLSLIGLLSALSGDGIWDILSWITLSVPCVVAIYYLLKGYR